ncbi:MAG TPA: ADYC domain-containing protein [Kofleriaceae bacterium]|nr:ADYC domain-containing protein [Kofleriaceae bacterium]
MKRLLVTLSSLLALLPTARVAHAICGFNCGLNTAEIANVPIRGLNLAGVPNAEKVAVVPGSVKLGATQTEDRNTRQRCRGRIPQAAVYNGKLDLQVANGQLTAFGVRRWFQLPAFFFGDCMKRAQFDVDVPFTREEPFVPGTTYDVLPLTVRIIDQAVTTTWMAKEPERTWVPAYLLEYGARGSSMRDNVCPQGERWIEDWQAADLRMERAEAPGPVPRGFTPQTPPGGDGYALIVQGETYDHETGDPLIRRDRMWFNIACAGAALSKMRLLGVDPMQENPQGLTRTTLKMITAKYRGRWSGTKTGTPIHWERPQLGTRYLGAPDERRIGPREALWTAKGAICADHFRIWHRNFQRGNTPVAPPTPQLEPAAGSLYKSERDERIGLALSPCSEDIAVTDDVLWITHTVDHVETD